MDVSASMSRAVFAVAPDTSLEAAARLLIRHHIGGAPVVDAQSKPIGFLSAKDLLDPDRAHSAKAGHATCYRLVDGAREPIDCGPAGGPGVVADVMTTFVMSIPSGMTIAEAARLMIASDLHRVLVVDETRCIRGVLSSVDVMRVLSAAS